MTNILKTLCSTPFFLSLPNPILEKVAETCVSVPVKAGEIFPVGANALGYLNLISEGQWKIKRKNLAGVENIVDGKAGAIFGEIDGYLGVGDLVEAVATTDSHLLTFTRSALNDLAQTVPEFREQLFAFRASLSAAKGTPKQVGSAASPSGTLRINRRAPVHDQLLKAILSDGRIVDIRDVSISGIFLNGESIGPASETLSFIVISKIQGLPEKITAEGKIVRADASGAAIHLNFLTPADQSLWADVVIRLTSLELSDVFQPKLVELVSPLSVHFALEGVFIPGNITQLGTSGAILSCNQALNPKNSIRVTLKLGRSGAGLKSVEASAEVMRLQDLGYLIRFIDLGLPQQALIQEYLEGETEVFSEEAPANLPLEVSSEEEFEELYLRDVKNGTLVLGSEYEVEAGQRVFIQLKVLAHKDSKKKNYPPFDLVGEVVRKTESGSVLKLEMIPPSIRTRMENIFKSSKRIEFNAISRDKYKAAKDQKLIYPAMAMFVVGGLFWIWAHWPLANLMSGRSTQLRDLSPAYGFGSEMGLEDKTIQPESEAGGPFSLKEVSVVKCNPLHKDCVFYLNQGRQVKVTKRIFSQLPPGFTRALHVLSGEEE